MKSFSDPNTPLEQEKANNATFMRRDELMRQYGQPITARNLSTQIVAGGVATSPAQ